MPALHEDVKAAINVFLTHLTEVPDEFFRLTGASERQKTLTSSSGVAVTFALFNWSTTMGPGKSTYIAYQLRFPLEGSTGSLQLYLYDPQTRTTPGNRAAVHAGYTTYLNNNDDTVQSIHQR